MIPKNSMQKWHLQRICLSNNQRLHCLNCINLENSYFFLNKNKNDPLLNMHLPPWSNNYFYHQWPIHFPKVGNGADQNLPRHTRKLYFVLGLYIVHWQHDARKGDASFYGAVPVRLIPLNYTFVCISLQQFINIQWTPFALSSSDAHERGLQDFEQRKSVYNVQFKQALYIKRRHLKPISIKTSTVQVETIMY